MKQLGSPAPDRTWEAAIVVQGPYVKPHTTMAVETYLKRNASTVLVIVATTTPLEEIDNKIPLEGRLVFLYVETPSKEERPHFWRTNTCNQNRQRLSSFLGIEFAERLHIPLTLKCRSDAFLGKRDITRYLTSEFLEKYPVWEQRMHPDFSRYRGRSRLVTSDCTYILDHENKPLTHHVADFWLFGRTTDLISYFETRETSSWNWGEGIATHPHVESNLAEQWMRDVGIDERMGMVELALRYLVIVSSIEVEFVWSRFHAFENYFEEGAVHLARIPDYDKDRRFFFSSWLENYRKHVRAS